MAEKEIDDSILIAIVLFFGIPHGSLDYAQFKLKKSGTSRNKFILNYLLLFLAYLMIWILHPFNGLLIFISLSIYHFGQEHFENLNLENVGLGSFLIHGCFVLLVPFFFHYPELTVYINAITSVLLPSLDHTLTTAIACMLILANLGLSVYLFRRSSNFNLLLLKR